MAERESINISQHKTTQNKQDCDLSNADKSQCLKYGTFHIISPPMMKGLKTVRKQ